MNMLITTQSSVSVLGSEPIGFESPPDSASSNSSSSASSGGSSPTDAKISDFVTAKSTNNNNNTYCICKRSATEEYSNEDDIMIECDNCKDWLHGKCVNLTSRLMADIEIYICPRCHTDKLQTINKKRKNFHRHDFTDANAAKKPVQAGTPVFVEQLLKRKFLDAFEHNIIVDIENGDQLSKDYFEKNGFDRPILVRNKTGLGFTMPSASEIDLSKIEDIVGGEYLIDVIDVHRQETYPMSINELNSYFKEQPREKVYNLISFEISKTKLTENITAPQLVHDISWVSNGVWPADGRTDEHLVSNPKTDDYIVKPEVQKYCLISAATSYTDFHVDFGGSSVWYHTVKGSKIFYLIEPTEENLKIYEQWNMLKNHSEVFLGDRVKKCYKFEISAGNTIFLPTGWIHAVYTPDDSLVFGGNFLQSFNIPLQIKCYEMEVRLKTPEKYRFPAFETLQWYAAKWYTQYLKDHNSKRECISLKLYNGLKFLNNTLRKWINSKDFYQTHDYETPKKINCDKLVKIMSKELTKAELFLKTNGLYKSNTGKLNTENDRKMYVDGNHDQEVESKAPKQQKEILNYQNMNLLEIKLDSNEDASDEPNVTIEPLTAVKNEQPIVVKIDEPNPSSLKLKLKLVKNPSMPDAPAVAHVDGGKPAQKKSTNGTAKTTASIDELIRKTSDDEMNKEEDEIIKDLKNSYQDSDYVYPSLKKGKSSSGANQETSFHEDEESVNDAAAGEGKKSVRKRKLKPHAAQYLQPKQVKKPVEPPKLIATTEFNKEKKKKTLIEKMREKNLKMGQEHMTANNDHKRANEDDDDEYKNDRDYEQDDDDDDDDDIMANGDNDEDDDDEDFKLKCKNNLKLSKKITKKLLKQQSGENGTKKAPAKNKTATSASSSTTSVAASVSSSTSSSTNQPPKSDAKKFKKGFATTKQRLGKLLKLNRVVNI